MMRYFTHILNVRSRKIRYVVAPVRSSAYRNWTSQ